MTYKLLVIDIDGTLLNEQNIVSEADKKAISEVRKRGIPVSLCTGRVNEASRPVLAELKLDGYHIFADGAVVSSADNTQHIYLKPIEKKVALELADYVHGKKVRTIDFFTPDHCYIEPDAEPWMQDIRRNYFGLELFTTNFTALCRKEKIIKATLGVSSEKERAVAGELMTFFQDRLRFSYTKNVTFPELDFINIINPAVSKAEAIRFLASYLGLSLDEVMAIGDGKNDIPLLTEVGLAVAMGHAPDEVKKVAHHVTLDVAHSGVAVAVRKFLL
ncbi:MAG: Cof-type HAD-IIB family hydrolase [Chloroflexota bacterium]